MGLTRGGDLAGEILVVNFFKRTPHFFLLEKPKRNANTYFSVFRTLALVTF